MSLSSTLNLSEALFTPNDERAWSFATLCPRYGETSVETANIEGCSVWFKDESERFGMGSFKALGGIYAIAQLLIQQFEQQRGFSPVLDEGLMSALKPIAQNQQFICASAGNHGLAVATGAQLFGARARIHVSAEVPKSFTARLEAKGAEVRQSGASYEESLQAANLDADESGGVLVADGSWPGYLGPPALVMEGYTVLANELANTFKTLQTWPSDVYLQAGVGGMAAAVTWVIRHRWLEQPRIVIVEPTAAPCLALSAAAGDLVVASGPVSTMGRLDCKEASLLAFDTLARSSVEYLTVTDQQANDAVNHLQSLGLATSPSGSAGFAGWRIDQQLGKLAGTAPLVIVSEQAIVEE